MKHSTRAIAILAMFCCVLVSSTPPGYVQAQDTRIQKSHSMARIEAHSDPGLIIQSSRLSPTSVGRIGSMSCNAGCDKDITRSRTDPVGYRERMISHSLEEHILSVAITAAELTQPPPVVERTEPVTVSYSLTYPNGSSVKTSENGLVTVQGPGGQIVARVPLRLNQTSGAWIATWASRYSANLTDYSFTLNPVDFRDAYGNAGAGPPLVSSSLKLISASVSLSIEALSTLSRRQNETITIPTVYHDGSPLQNSTIKASIVDANGTASPINMTINGVLATNYIDLPAGANLGTWHLKLNFTDGYGNQGEGSFTFEVVPAMFKISVTLPQPVERTTTMNVSAAVIYPDDHPLTNGVNGNVSIGNMTQSLNLQYVSDNKTWNGLYYISQNATLGLYNVTIVAADSDGNAGRFTTDVPIVPASFQFAVPAPQIQVPPLNLTDIAVSVTYPNGTSLGDNVGTVTATYNNSSGGLPTAVFQYNATDTKWHLLFYTPDQRFKLYAITLVFAFDAHDIFGNFGSKNDVLEMTVTTPISLLVLAAVVGVIVPASLLAWAMITVTKKRRKHKP